MIDGPESFADFFSVSCETLEKLRVYARLLEHWQKTHNLVAPSTLPLIWSRHFADSAQLLYLAPCAQHWLDMGSGAGFPGMVVAILMADQSSLDVHLVESHAKKVAFLNAVRRETGVPAVIHADRMENMTNHLACSFDVISARALAPLKQLCAYAAPFMKKNTIALFPKGRDACHDVDEAMSGFNMTYCEARSLTDPQGRILIVKSLERH